MARDYCWHSGATHVHRVMKARWSREGGCRFEPCTLQPHCVLRFTRLAAVRWSVISGLTEEIEGCEAL